MLASVYHPVSDFDVDLQHNLLVMSFDGKLHCAPLDKSVHRVLDAGCGTGIWSIDFGRVEPLDKSLF